MRLPGPVRAALVAATPAKVRSWRQAVRAQAERSPFLTFRPPGHFYSPLPTMEEAVTHLSRPVMGRAVTGVELCEDDQLAWLARIATVAGTYPRPDGRYQVDNPSFCLADALTLRAMLLLLRPARLVEVGSGWSSAVTLDTRDEAGLDLDVTYIEPYPELLESLLRPGDRETVRILPQPVQAVGTEPFDALGPGDVLFIDCSHVVRVGSDAQFLYAEVLPRLPAGVVVHVHDIFFPFEYPLEWVQEGRLWNEAYVLRAMLTGATFDMLVWNDWAGRFLPDAFARALPATAGERGGSLWLRRR